jgi:hypothetical protein
VWGTIAVSYVLGGYGVTVVVKEEGLVLLYDLSSGYEYGTIWAVAAGGDESSPKPMRVAEAKLLFSTVMVLGLVVRILLCSFDFVLCLADSSMGPNWFVNVYCGPTTRISFGESFDPPGTTRRGHTQISYITFSSEYRF